MNSFALIGGDGRMVNWDEGFEQEFQFAAPLLKPGIPYAEIALAASEDPYVTQFMLDNSGASDIEMLVQDGLEGLGNDRSGEYRTPDGRVIRVDQHRTLSGDIRRFARDITNDIDENQKLSETYRRLDAVDAGLGAVLTKSRRNPDGSYVFEPITKELARLLDLPASFVGQDPLLIFSRMKWSAADAARSAAEMERAAQTLEVITQEYPIRDGNDRLRWMRQSIMPHREADGVTVFSGVMRDVTREKEAEDEVEMLRSVVVRSSDSIAIFENGEAAEHNSKIIYVNAKFTELFGWSSEQLIGNPVAYLESAKLNPEVPAMLIAARRRDDGKSVEFETRDKNGRLFWVEARIMTIQKFENGSFRWVIISRDISERRAIHEALMRAKEEAEAGNRAKSNFLANMSHELRTPLNAIIGFTELIEQGVARNGWTASCSEYLTDVSEGGRHLLDLINTILDLSKIEAGQLALNLGPVDLRELALSTVALVSGMARESNIALGTDISPEGWEIEGDYLKLKQVLLNILSNAIKFTPAGGKVDIRLRFTETEVVTTVTDTGCGIADADLERVMLPFVQVTSSLSRKFGGSGLGLSIARELCGLHGGGLEISSVEGQGTTVRIALPRVSQ
jgi:PAS domain S-box-containing protein